MEDNGDSTPWVNKALLPILVTVVGATGVAALTPAGDWARERLFPTSSAVRGSVHMDGEPVAGAEVRVDDRDPEATSSSGSFLIQNVGSGSHSLHVAATGARPYQSSFVVEERSEETELGVIEVEPALKLLMDGSFTLQPPRDMEEASPTFFVHYDILVWIEGDEEVMERIDSVSYSFPPDLQPNPVEGSSRDEAFCYHVTGTLETGIGSSTEGEIAAEVAVDEERLHLTADPEENSPSGYRPRCSARSSP